MDKRAHAYTLTADGIDDLILKTDATAIIVESGEVVELPVRVQVDAYDLKKRSTEIHFTLNAVSYEGVIQNQENDLTVVEPARFLGPAF